MENVAVEMEICLYVAFSTSGTDEITERLKQPISGVYCSVICVESAGPLTRRDSTFLIKVIYNI